MEGIVICGVVLAAIMVIRSQSQETETGAYAVVRQGSDDDGAADVFTASSSLSLFEHSSLSSDDDWPSCNAMDGSFVTSGYEPDSSMDTSRWTDPMYAHEPDNIYHNTSMDPTYHDDDSFSISSGYDDSFSTSSFDDSCSGSSFDDSFSSSSSFDD